MNLNDEFYVLTATDAKHGSIRNLINKKRILIGSSETCDIVVNHPEVANIHAVIEVFNGKKTVYDMNTITSTFVNGNKVVAESLKVGDKLSFGSKTFYFNKYKTEEVPPVLNVLSPNLPPVMGKQGITEAKNRAQKFNLPSRPIVHEMKGETTPRIVYPLTLDPKAEFSEYIFEDLKDLYPIFKYDHKYRAVEVIMLFKGRVHDVSYVPVKNGSYNLVGQKKSNHEIELSQLGRDEEFQFIDVANTDVYVNKPMGYKTLHLSDGMTKDEDRSNYFLKEDDILKYSKDDVELYLRLTETPPVVSPGPFFKKDKDLFFYLFLILFFISAFVFAIGLYTPEEEEEEEKAPERIAKILYRRKFFKPSVTKDIEKLTKKVKKVAKKPVKKAPTPKKVEKVAEKKAEKIVKKNNKKQEVKKGANKKFVGKQKEVAKNNSNTNKSKNNKKGPVKASNQIAKKAGTKKAAAASGQKRSKVTGPSKGRVEVYKAVDFSSSISSLLAKGGSTKGASSNSYKSGSSSGASGYGKIGGGGDTIGSPNRAKIGGNAGNLSGATQGELDSGKGAGGLGKKTNVFTAGIPSRTVVLGSIDPDIIRRILRDHIPQFQYCYQKVLTKSASKFSGVIDLKFDIGASGSVTKSGLRRKSAMPAEVKRCVLGVLNGIKFPEPLGGGTVSVEQPLNYYPVSK